MTGHPLLHTLVIWSTLRWTILSARLLFIRSDARSHWGNRYFRQTATRLAKGVGCTLIKIPFNPPAHSPPQPPGPQINPLSAGHKENGHGCVWFISHRAIIRAQLASRLPHKGHTPRPSFTRLPLLSRPHTSCHTHSTCHSEEGRGTKTGPYQKELIKN